ncbi:hypothetical protein J3Q64DRAFT_1156648 [Phycomyces blakesleeanus]|uniref:Uncharacterized protein n=2 Tax=Phycomyces blakesleeanus TaxID=4837 RepID=A0A163EFK5_PHYB8|nr:hypothetical protein PHYBLDRAFT_157535 [Phycomyces blakesleeanus NRRL 1555(-)]OAD78370.1 hypothetical protein PHYBLDRAFT_157535 [Phycomyces blakesleeanus NRRL 1555(-)]|eukprot:XP_018296410.1 hypothetical protein PHYBLDRAFT_157535 [Phycomyces blakesleeanus NRRL 1555(-)]
MHPALIFGLVVCGTIVIYEGVKLTNHLYERYSEQSDYYEHVRTFNEKRRSGRPHSPPYDDNDDDEDDEVLQSAWNRAYSGLRLRRSAHSDSRLSEDGHSDYELSEIERSILDRKKALQREQALLDDAEQELHRRKQSLSSRGNSLLGLDTTHCDNEITHNPFGDDFGRLTDNTSSQSTLSPFADPPFILPPLDTVSTDPLNVSISSTPESPRQQSTISSIPIDREELWAADSDDNQEMEFPLVLGQGVSDSEESWSEVGRELGMTTRRQSQGSIGSHDSNSSGSLGSQTQHSEDGNMSFDMMSVSDNGL